MHPLSQAFLEALSNDVRAAAGRDPELVLRLEQVVRRACAAWPELGLDAQAFLVKAAASVHADDDPLAALERLHVEDLYLATACARGDRVALASFHATFLPVLKRAVAAAAPLNEREEVCQRVLARLFSARPPQTPHIARYAGRGSMRRWLDVVATREAFSYARISRPATLEDEALVTERVLARDDPELAVLRQRYREELKTALQHAWIGLSVRQRNVVRHELLDGMDGQQIATLYGVHKGTVTKWRQQCRATLIARMKAFLEERLGLEADAMYSMARLLDSELDLSLARLLERTGPTRTSG